MNTSARQKIAVIGGGIAGLSTAWRLASAGCSVQVFDASPHASQGGGGTWASAGMICAQLEMSGAAPALAAFAVGARAAWPSFAAQLEQASGINPGFAECGALHAYFGSAPPHHRAAGLQLLDGAQSRAIEPQLSDRVTGAIWAPREAIADPRWTALALSKACHLSGVTIFKGVRIERILEHGGCVTGLRTQGDDTGFDHVVLAAGAWSGDLLDASGLSGPRVRPVKGQVLNLDGQADLLVRRLIWTDEVYVAPHRDGRIVVGATQEEAGFDTSVDDERIEGLREAAIRVLPCLAQLKELERGYGFRPVADDALPVIGGIGLSGLTLASGQFRNGILFAPLVAAAAAQHALGARLPDIALPFSASRFVGEAA